jgi:hypothetical protein
MRNVLLEQLASKKTFTIQDAQKISTVDEIQIVQARV